MVYLGFIGLVTTDFDCLTHTSNKVLLDFIFKETFIQKQCADECTAGTKSHYIA